MYKQRAYYTEPRIRFEFRKSQVGSPTGTIYAIIYVEGQTPEPRSTGIRCSRAEWDGRTSPRARAAARSLNEKLVLWEQALLQAARSLTEQGDPVTPGGLIDVKNYKNRPLFTVRAIYELFLAHKKSLIGPKRSIDRKAHQISESTYKGYEKRWPHLEQYLRHLKSTNLLAMKVDAPFAQGYYHYLLKRQAPPTATMNVRLLTEMCRWAFRSGHLRELKTDASVPGTTEPQSLPYNLTEADIEKLENLSPLTATQERVRDAFLLARELCLHYADYHELEPSHFTYDKQGRLILEKYRVKQASGRRIKIVAIVSERAQRIWNQYGQQIPIAAGNPYLRRVIKDLGEMAGLERHLNFSHARDSGIFRLVVGGCSEIQIKMAAGWTSTKILPRYVNHDRQLVEGMPTPTEPKSSRDTAGYILPFLQVHKAS